MTLFLSLTVTFFLLAGGERHHRVTKVSMVSDCVSKYFLFGFDVVQTSPAILGLTPVLTIYRLVATSVSGQLLLPGT